MQKQCRRSLALRVAAEAGPALEKPQMSAKPKVKEQTEQSAPTSVAPPEADDR